jgi:flagellar biosynthesis protein FlhF
MRLKVFQAATVAEAMAEIRRTLGDDAVIVATDTAASGARVTAATDSAPPFEPTESDRVTDGAPDIADLLYERLDGHRVPAPLIERLVGMALTTGGNDPAAALGGALNAAFAFRPLQRHGAPQPILLIGPPGQGKSVTTARLAARAVLAGHPVRVVAADMARAGAFAQISELCRPMGVKPLPWSPQAPLDGGDGLVVIDGPGVNPFDAADLTNVSEIVAATGAEPVLVLAAGTEATEAAEIADAFAAVGAQRLIATRLDATRRWGGILAAADAGLALAEAGIGRALAETLVAFQPLVLAHLLLSESPALDAFARANHEEAA